MTNPSDKSATLLRAAPAIANYNPWRTVVLSAVIFAAGGASVWGIERMVSPKVEPAKTTPEVPVGDGPPVEFLVNRMHDELSLSTEQTQQVRTIYETRYAALRKIRQEISPRLSTEYTGLRADIEKVLTPAQFAWWDQRYQNVRNRMLPPPPPGAGGPGGPEGPEGTGGMGGLPGGPPPPPPGAPGYQGGGSNPGGMPPGDMPPDGPGMRDFPPPPPRGPGPG